MKHGSECSPLKPSQKRRDSQTAPTPTLADFIISNDSSCLMQIQGLLDRQGKPMKSLHIAEVLASR